MGALIVKCPKCGKNQRTMPRKRIKDSVKKCVFCGKSFKVHSHIDKLSRIVEVEKERNTGGIN